jgi:hypothetical protein
LEGLISERDELVKGAQVDQHLMTELKEENPTGAMRSKSARH